MVPFWILSIIRHLVFRGPQKGIIILTTTQVRVSLASTDISWTPVDCVLLEVPSVLQDSSSQRAKIPRY